MTFDAATISQDLRTGLSQLEKQKLLASSVNPAVVDSLTAYLAALTKWNKAYNLTAVREPRAMVQKHILDSLSADGYLSGEKILDVGTGAGLPGIPLALCNPDKHFTLLDSNGKKIRFLQHIVGELDMQNVVPVQARVESFEPGETYDVIISRAFASIVEFASSCGRLVAPAGCLLAMKGKLPNAELDELPSTWLQSAVEKIDVPGLEGDRHIIVIRVVDS